MNINLDKIRKRTVNPITRCSDATISNLLAGVRARCKIFSKMSNEDQLRIEITQPHADDAEAYHRQVMKKDGSDPFLQHRKHNVTTWMMRDGSVIKIADMTTDHIQNCIKMLESGNQQNTCAYVGLTNALEKRQDVIVTRKTINHVRCILDQSQRDRILI